MKLSDYIMENYIISSYKNTILNKPTDVSDMFVSIGKKFGFYSLNDDICDSLEYYDVVVDGVKTKGYLLEYIPSMNVLAYKTIDGRIAIGNSVFSLKTSSIDILSERGLSKLYNTKEQPDSMKAYSLIMVDGDNRYFYGSDNNIYDSNKNIVHDDSIKNKCLNMVKSFE